MRRGTLRGVMVSTLLAATLMMSWPAGAGTAGESVRTSNWSTVVEQARTELWGQTVRLLQWLGEKAGWQIVADGEPLQDPPVPPATTLVG
ncbi:MAG: hypothetical protein U0002_06230 [Thermoanaerobaculia bacterium]